MKNCTIIRYLNLARDIPLAKRLEQIINWCIVAGASTATVVWIGTFFVDCRAHVWQKHRVNTKTNHTGSTSDKSLRFDLCIFKAWHNRQQSKKEDLLFFGPVHLVRTDLSKCHCPTFSTKRKLYILAEHQGNTKQRYSRTNWVSWFSRWAWKQWCSGSEYEKRWRPQTDRAARSKANLGRVCLCSLVPSLSWTFHIARLLILEYFPQLEPHVGLISPLIFMIPDIQGSGVQRSIPGGAASVQTLPPPPHSTTNLRHRSHSNGDMMWKLCSWFMLDTTFQHEHGELCRPPRRLPPVLEGLALLLLA